MSVTQRGHNPERPGWRRTPVLLLVAAALVLAVVAGVLVATRGGTPTPQEVAESYPERRMRFLDGRICVADGYGDVEAQRGMMMLEKALLTGETSGSTECGTDWDVDTANDLVLQATDRIGRDDDLKVLHGGGLTMSRIYLRYRERSVGGVPLLPAAEELKEELSFYLSRGVRSPDSGTGVLDVDPDDEDPQLVGTENHQLQQIALGLLLTQVFTGESYEGRPMADYRDFYRRAFFAYLSRGGERSKFLADMPGDEKDSVGYSHTYLGDLWAIRDLGPDEVVRRHAEILIDRMLADYAEDAVKGFYTGYSGRHYQRSQLNSRHTHVYGYLLFDSLGYTPEPEELAEDSEWGNWLHVGMVTSDYHPGNPAFPLALVDLARAKDGGYLVREGVRPAANWVEDDLALGFQLGGPGAYDSHEGGFYLVTRRDRRMGLQVAPYVPSPFTDTGDEIQAGAFLHKNKPVRENYGVVAPRLAVIRTGHVPGGDDDRYPDRLEARLWVQDEPDNGFEDVEEEAGWIFLRGRSPHRDRDVYLAVTAPVGGFTRLPDTQGGRAFELGDARDGFTVWEVGTSDEHDSFDAFRQDVLDNDLRVAPDAVTYTSSARGTTLTYDRTDDRSHLVDGEPVDWDEFAHGVHNPYVVNRHGSHRMTISKAGYSARYDWSPDDDGSYDTLPVKTVLDGEPSRR